jgi:hypothetical protein
VRPGLQRVLDTINAPAWVRNGRADVVATNSLGRALYAPVLDSQARPANTARFTFLDPRANEFYADWERTASHMVAVLRAEAGRNPYDRGLTDLVGELSTRSEEFRTRWAAYNVLFHRTDSKQLHHPVVGDLDLTYEALELPSDPGLTLLVYTAEADTPTQDALNLLASWAATLEQEQRAESQTPTTRRDHATGNPEGHAASGTARPLTAARAQFTVSVRLGPERRRQSNRPGGPVTALEIIVVVGFAVLAGSVLGPRWRVTLPLVLLVLGAALGLLPTFRHVAVPPELVLLVILPPSCTGRA